MTTKIFIWLILLMGFVNLQLFAQPDTGTGIPWGSTFTPYESLLLNENFMGFDKYFNGTNINDGNSKNELDPSTGEMIFGYINDSLSVPIFGSQTGKIHYKYYQCAFAPEWKTVRAESSGGENTENVSDGFVEISRPDTKYSTVPTLKGYFIIDLREVDFVEGMYWSHSSTGWGKRGVMCEFSIDDGIIWDTLRYQPGENSYASSFHKDITSGEKTFNLYRCDQAAYGMTWEDEIYASNLMLRFVCAGEQTIQTLRLHDIKIYGTYTAPSSTVTLKENELKIQYLHQKIMISQFAKIELYSTSGSLIKLAKNVKTISLSDVPPGVYLVKASTGTNTNTMKIAIN